MSRPKREDGEPKQLATYVPERIDKALKKRAETEGTTKRAVVVAALSAYLDPAAPSAGGGAADE